MAELEVPDPCLVVLVGASGAGESTFARRHFLETEIVSSDPCRGAVCDDEDSLAASDDAFERLRFAVRQRLAGGKLAVVDATNLQPDARRPLLALAKEMHLLPVAIVLHAREVQRVLDQLEKEGFKRVHVLRTTEEAESATIVRRPLDCDRRNEAGPFDIIGDVHGCFAELVVLLDRLGWQDLPTGDLVDRSPSHPGGRRLILLGDLVDRGPGIVPVLKLAMRMVADGTALCLPGNHEAKLLRKLRGRDVRVSHGLEQTLEQLAREPPEFSEDVATFIDARVSHYVLDGGGLVVAHAGLKESLQGRDSQAVRSFALFGETTGETDELGLPVRYAWANDYRGSAAVVYGHTPVADAEWLNNTICLDTACVFGGKLSALRWPERELVSVAAHRTHYEPARPLRPPSSPLEHDGRE